MRLAAEGLPNRAIAARTGIPLATIESWRYFGRGALKSGPSWSSDVVAEADRWARWGMNDCAVSRLIGVPHGTVRGWRTNPRKCFHARSSETCPRCGDAPLDQAAYAYLLGLYLGDGHIVLLRKGVYRLSIAMDQKYPRLIDECEAVIRAVRARGKMSVLRGQQEGCVSVYAMWKHWPCLFPQHGPGMKHTRKIALEPWQQQIVDRHPKLFLRGLIYSDGCRAINTVKPRGKAYSYPRYQFTNYSTDIRKIFCDACDALGIPWRQSNRVTISVSRREGVHALDRFVGPKS